MSQGIANLPARLWTGGCSSVQNGFKPAIGHLSASAEHSLQGAVSSLGPMNGGLNARIFA